MAIETSNMIDEEMSDMSFSLNFNDIIGSVDEKSEMDKLKGELQAKDNCIQELLKKIEELDQKVKCFAAVTSSSGKSGAPKSSSKEDQINIVN